MDQYKIVREIGRGGFGRALLVKAVNSEELKVVKEMNLSGMNTSARETAFREVEILSTLKHTNIIRYRGCTRQKKNLYILMDYADGGDLGGAIADRKGALWPEDHILDWFVQICLAIKYLHDRKILHRDLKPQNVFISSGSIIKLGDFGIAKTLEHTGDMAKTAIGTPLYCSPEICVGRKYNSKSDIWSLGCILYEMISLHRPFSGENMGDIMRKIMSRQPKALPPQYSTELRDLVNSLLQKNPDQRPSINDILKLPLIRNKAIALLGKTLAREELNHGVFHGAKPGSTPEELVAKIDEINLAIAAEPKGAPTKKAGIFKDMVRMAKNLQQVIQGENMVDVPEEVDELRPGEFYFMGRRLILRTVSENDPLPFKVEAVRAFLEDLLGVEKFRQIYEAAQACDSNAQFEVLEMTKSDAYVFQLILQLVAYETQMHNGTQTLKV